MTGPVAAPPLVIKPDLLDVRRIGPWLAEVLAPLGAEAAAISAPGIELAVHELAMNSIDHAAADGAPLRLEAELCPPVLTIRLWDQGKEFDPSTVVPPIEGQPQIGGYGLMIIELLASHLSYERLANGNLWKAEFAV